MLNARQLQSTVRRRSRRTARPFTNAKLRTSARELRELFGLPLAPVAKALGVSISALSNLERGRNVSLFAALRLAAFFEKPVEEIWQLKDRHEEVSMKNP